MAATGAPGLRRCGGADRPPAAARRRLAMERLGLDGFPCHRALRLAADRAGPYPGAAPPQRQGERTPCAGADRSDAAGAGIALPRRSRPGDRGGQPRQLPGCAHPHGSAAGPIRLCVQTGVAAQAGRRHPAAPARQRLCRAFRQRAQRGGCARPGGTRVRRRIPGLLPRRHLPDPAGTAAVPARRVRRRRTRWHARGAGHPDRHPYPAARRSITAALQRTPGAGRRAVIGCKE